MNFVIRSNVAAGLVAVGLWAAAAGPVAAQRVAPASGKALCSALTPTDFTKLGIPVSALDNANLDGTDGAYCVYRSTAGKVEFDIFFPAGANAQAIRETHKTVLGEGGGKYDPVVVPGATDAQLALAVPGSKASASVVVLKDKAVFDIVIPASDKARQQLIALATLVLGRLKG